MATVPNKASGRGALDKKLTSPNRRLTGPVENAAIPLYVGEQVLESDTGLTYKATTLDATGWQQVMPTF